jgi:[acyl-carrier-protein] S-malonyltransferase
VRWEESMRVLIAEGVAQWAEVGAGGVLTGLLRNIDPGQSCQKFGEASDTLAF